jgi:putative peptidoglycan lipid II flippase
MLANMVLNLLFVLPWYLSGIPGAHAGLALATSASAYLNAGLLYRGLLREGIYQPGPALPHFWIGLWAALGVMVALLILLAPGWDQWSGWAAAQRGVVLIGLIAAGSGAFLLTLWLAGLRPRQFLLHDS